MKHGDLECLKTPKLPQGRDHYKRQRSAPIRCYCRATTSVDVYWINVGKTWVKQSPQITMSLIRWYVYHSQMGGLWHCFTHFIFCWWIWNHLSVTKETDFWVAKSVLWWWFHMLNGNVGWWYFCDFYLRWPELIGDVLIALESVPECTRTPWPQVSYDFFTPPLSVDSHHSNIATVDPTLSWRCSFSFTNFQWKPFTFAIFGPWTDHSG